MSTASSVGIEASRRLTGAGISRLCTVLLGIVVVAAVFFAAAGTLEATRGWIYYGGTLVYQVVALIVGFIFFPGVSEVVNERGKRQIGVKRWDRVFQVLYSLLLLLSPLVGGLDVRYRVSRVPIALALAALALTLAAYLFVHWAMVVNRHAETGVRIQEDRHHQVVSSGPYAIVRHPFYISMIVVQLVYPVAVGALLACAPALVMAALLVWRTAREDRTLQAELPGYADYATRVRHRLVPGLW